MIRHSVNPTKRQLRKHVGEKMGKENGYMKNNFWLLLS